MKSPLHRGHRGLYVFGLSDTCLDPILADPSARGKPLLPPTKYVLVSAVVPAVPTAYSTFFLSSSNVLVTLGAQLRAPSSWAPSPPRPSTSPKLEPSAPCWVTPWPQDYFILLHTWLLKCGSLTSPEALGQQGPAPRCRPPGVG